MGLLYYREGNRDEAAKWFDKAIELDTQRFLPHYFHAKLRLENRVEVGELESIEQSLNRSIDLNPGFGPAYAQLAKVYVSDDEKLDQALTLAQKAVELEPASAELRICLAQIWMTKGKAKEAREPCAQLSREG
jgi:tetratricopeptide (TPR) repeat protein